MSFKYKLIYFCKFIHGFGLSFAYRALVPPPLYSKAIMKHEVSYRSTTACTVRELMGISFWIRDPCSTEKIQPALFPYVHSTMLTQLSTYLKSVEEISTMNGVKEKEKEEALAKLERDSWMKSVGSSLNSSCLFIPFCTCLVMWACLCV